MLQTRVIPCLLLREESLVKTIRFGKYGYIGAPVNTVRIFNELEVDELIFLDIMASRRGQKPNFQLLKEIADECFMPLAYGGGIRTIEDARKIFNIGIEKIAINSYAMERPELISEIAKEYGNQSIIASIDIKKDFLGKYRQYVYSGSRKVRHKGPVEIAKRMEEFGAGEILLTSIDQEGTWKGFDVHLVKMVTDAVGIPVIAHGGCGSIEDISRVVKQGGASAVGVGSMVVYQNKGMGVLINFPDKGKLEAALK